MQEVEVTKLIDSPAVDVWEVIDDFGNVKNYHPLVAASPLLGELTCGEGAERKCRFHNGGTITERVTAYEKGVGYEVTITDPGPFPLVTAIAELRVTPVAANRSEVRFGMRFRPKYGPAGWLLGALVMKRQFRNTLRMVLDGLEAHMATGEVIGPPAGTVQESAAAA